MNTLRETARALVWPGKGILAADESTPTITKRFKSINVESTEGNRRDYRAALFSTPRLGEFISGVILFDETLRQSDRNGVRMVELLHRQGIIPGIKVDAGTNPLAYFPGEKITEGLDGLGKRLTEYRDLGAKFTKWRAVITIGDGIPTRTCIRANAHALARFAALSQETGLVPIVEPEVLMDGTHSLERCVSVTEEVLQVVFDELFQQRVFLDQMLLKASMVIAGKNAPQGASIEQVARASLDCLKRTVPPFVPGIVFLSGGQSDVLATEHLNAMNRLDNVPWQLSFSYGRALQAPALSVWRGLEGNIEAAQNALFHRAKCNSAARFGRYSRELEATKIPELLSR